MKEKEKDLVRIMFDFKKNGKAQQVYTVTYKTFIEGILGLSLAFSAI